jgi:hypothetical protein
VLTVNSDSPDPLSKHQQPASPQRRANARVVFDGYIRRDEFCDEFGISLRTEARWNLLGQGPPRIRVGRTILYSVEAVREWLRSQQMHKPPAGSHHVRLRKKSAMTAAKLNSQKSLT